MKNKIINYILTILIIIVLILIVIQTQGRYFSEVSSKLNADMASFLVKISAVDFKDGSTKEFSGDLQLTSDNGDSNIAEGKIAPGFIVSGTLIIDATGTNVPIKYTVTFGEITYYGEEAPYMELIEVVASHVDSKGETVIERIPITLTSDNKKKCTADIALEDNDKPITIKVKTIWNWTDDAENIKGIEEGIFNIPINVAVEQKI